MATVATVLLFQCGPMLEGEAEGVLVPNERARARNHRALTLDAARMAKPRRADPKLLETLKSRFEKNPSRHPGVKWADVQARLEAKLSSLDQMEQTGGEPDVVVLGKDLLVVDCSTESPAGRRSLCFDAAALASRKENKPKGSAMAMAADMGIELLTEEQYRALQKLAELDLKTSSWVQTPAPIRKLGGALFCDRRYDTVFTYHNGAESYYAARGFRGALKL